MSSAQSPGARRYSSGSGSWGGAGTRNGSSAASGTTHGETEVANDLPRNGPSGWYSQRWMSRALQSLTSTKPKTCSAAWLAGIGSRARCRGRSRTRARARCRAARRGRSVAPRPARRAGAGRGAAARACPTARPSSPARGSRPAGGASWAAGGRRRAGTCGRGWWRARATSRSRRSRRPGTGVAARPPTSGTAVPSGGPPASTSWSVERSADQAGGPSASSGLSAGPSSVPGGQAGGREQPARLELAQQHRVVAEPDREPRGVADRAVGEVVEPEAAVHGAQSYARLVVQPVDGAPARDDAGVTWFSGASSLVLLALAVGAPAASAQAPELARAVRRLVLGRGHRHARRACRPTSAASR